MTVLSPPPVTAMGLPLRAGLSRCSTEAKKASMSTHATILAMVDYTRTLTGGQHSRCLSGADSKTLSVVVTREMATRLAGTRKG